MKELEESFQVLAGDRHRHAKLTHDLAQIDEQLRHHERVRLRWSGIVANAGDSLRKLEGIGFAALFHTLLGNRSDKVDAAEAVLLRAKVQHDDCEAAMEPLLAERRRVADELASYGDLAARERDLLQRKAAAVRERGGEQAFSLLGFAEREGRLASAVREVDEAIAAGRQALMSLEAASGELRKASSWGTFDMMGGGLIVTMVKHNHVDEARNWIALAQRRLDAFRREVHDVERTAPPLAIDITGLEKCADHFLDGLLFDWIVQRRIDQAKQKVESTIQQVRHALLDLERRSKDVQALLEAVRRERAAWLAGP
jgi:hypothetical protein